MASPYAVFNVALSFRALPVTADTHNSTAVSVVFVKAMCLPSGLHSGVPILGFAGPLTFVSPPSEMRLNVNSMKLGARWRLFDFGLMRRPASLNIGCASTAMGG
jgi:hypothetical protein